MSTPDFRQTSVARKAILDRDKWRCTEILQPREVRPGFWMPREACRCPVMGSEMLVRDGRAFCPRHAEQHDA